MHAANKVDLRRGSTFLPVDSWIYPAVARLYSLGYLRTPYLGLRPWTRSAVLAMLEDARTAEGLPPAGEAETLFDGIHRELAQDSTDAGTLEIESIYGRVRAVEGPILDDGYHLGQTFVNDFGRPSQRGFNTLTGFSARGEHSRFTLYVRGELQHTPAAPGYSEPVFEALAAIDKTPLLPQSTIPEGPIPARTTFHLLEANLSARVARHEISFGKSDAWLGPGFGGAMAWSNNAEDIYSLRINRAEPLHIPGLSRLIGDTRYDFFVGSLKGHAFPNAPWIHSEKISFKLSANLEFGFQRSVIWGGKGHVPITAAAFLRSFFSLSGVDPAVKFSRKDPGARFSTFDLSYRVPYLRRWVTVYTDSLVHDNVSPVSNPSRAGLRPGIYLAQFPRLPKLDLRVEGVSTDPQDPNSSHGGFLYYEAVQIQGYTNQGHLLGDWIGREAKGGQAWLTWHADSFQQVQLNYRNAKSNKDFIPGGTTLHDIGLSTQLRPANRLELAIQLQMELWKAPRIVVSGQRNVSTTVSLTYFPQQHLHLPSHSKSIPLRDQGR